MKELLTILNMDTTTRVTAEFPAINTSEPRYKHVANVISSYARTLDNEHNCVSYEMTGKIHNLPDDGDTRRKVMVVNQETFDDLIDGARQWPELVKAMMLANGGVHILNCGVPDDKVKAVLPNGEIRKS